MSKPKIAWCHHATDLYLTDEQYQLEVLRDSRVQRAYIKFIEYSALEREVAALKLELQSQKEAYEHLLKMRIQDERERK